MAEEEAPSAGAIPTCLSHPSRPQSRITLDYIASPTVSTPSLRPPAPLSVVSITRYNSKILLEVQRVSCSPAVQVGSDIEDTRPDPRDDGQALSKAVTSPRSTHAEGKSQVTSSLASMGAAYDDSGLVHLQGSVMGACSPQCRCRCHATKSQHSHVRANWLAPVLGSFLLSYNVLPVWRPASCTEPRCRRSGSSVLFKYSFPSWMCSRA